MRFSISFVLAVVMVASNVLPVFAQRERGSVREDLPVPISRPSDRSNHTRFQRVEAYTDGTGVLIRWQMAIETRNLGFNVHRIRSGNFELVNESMLLGASARVAIDPSYGGEYSTYDPFGDEFTSYFIESRSLSGNNSYSLEVVPKQIDDLKPLSGYSSQDYINASFSNNKNVEKGELALSSELQQIVNNSFLAPDPDVHRWVVGQPGLKLGVRRDGMYRVQRSTLESGGFDVNTDSANWRLFLNGNEQSIIIGQNDDYIEFYGKGIETNETDIRNYYLIADTTPGKRIATRVLRPFGGNVQSHNYPVTYQKKERSSYVNTIRNGDEENYWGRLISFDPESIPFSISGLDPNVETVTVQVRLQGFSAGLHTVNMSLNGNSLGQVSGDGKVSFAKEVEVSANSLVEGNNTIELSSTTGSDYSLFDSITVNYMRKYVADQNRVGFHTPGVRRVDLGGFSSESIRVFDITYDGEPAEIINLPIESDGSNYKVRLPASRAAVMYGVEDTGLLQVPSIVENKPSTLYAPSNGADLLIISFSNIGFLAASEQWAQYRRDQGYTAKVVDIADVFDEFNYGIKGWVGVNNFLRHSYENWSMAPKYVLLMGDGSHDPRNYEGFGNWDMIPTKIVNLIFEESGSDDALADFNGDGLAEMAVGRIPARNTAVLDIAFNKTVAFETDAMRSLDRGALFASDQPIGFDFELMNQQLSDELPESMPKSMILRQADGSTQAPLIAEMNTGKFLVNYAGHGSTGVWATSNFFGVNSVSQLTNADRLSLFIMLTCLNGYFLRPDADSLAEVLNKSSTGGTAASWASTGSTTPDIQLLMGRQFFKKLAEGDIPRMGDLIRNAKSVVPGGSDVRLSWVLLGDPLLKIH